MSRRTVTLPSSDSFFGTEDFTVSDIDPKSIVGWNDEVGGALEDRSKKFLGSFNISQDNFWDAIEKLKDVSEEDLKYDSIKNELERLIP